MRTSTSRKHRGVLFLIAALIFMSPGVWPVAALATGVEESVTGHVDFVNRLGHRVTYSLSAIKHADAAVTGEIEYGVEVAATGELLLKAHATITCFTIVAGNVALIGAVIDRRDPPAPPGITDGFITVVDNGQGEDDPPDLASAAFGGVAGSSELHCAGGGPAQPLFPVDRGNIQVRP
jgi:hypothetical protein